MGPAQEMGQGDGTLSRAAEMVAAAQHDFDRLNQELAQHIEAARSVWTGGGGTAFTSLGRAWQEKQSTIVSTLEQFGASLRSTEKDNLSTDDTQSAALERSRQRLG